MEDTVEFEPLSVISPPPCSAVQQTKEHEDTVHNAQPLCAYTPPPYAVLLQKIKEVCVMLSLEPVSL